MDSSTGVISLTSAANTLEVNNILEAGYKYTLELYTYHNYPAVGTSVWLRMMTPTGPTTTLNYTGGGAYYTYNNLSGVYRTDNTPSFPIGTYHPNSTGVAAMKTRIEIEWESVALARPIFRVMSYNYSGGTTTYINGKANTTYSYTGVSIWSHNAGNNLHQCVLQIYREKAAF